MHRVRVGRENGDRHRRLPRLLTPRRATSLVCALLCLYAPAGALAARAPDDPGWAGQWGLRLAGFEAVWPLAAAGVHPVIATIDTGARTTFPDLRGQLAAGWNLVAGNADTSDTAGHGTDVAIVAAALADNRYGLAGACPMCRVMPVRVSADGRASPAIIAAGIDWAVSHGARIINVSLAASGNPDTLEQAAVDRAVAAGAVVIAAAGNDGDAAPTYPAALHGVISVTGTDPQDRLYTWATRGPWVDLAAPGCEYGAAMCGTSYAPPVVAAAVGLLTAAVPQLTPAQAVAALRATAVPVAGIGGGRIDVARAAASLRADLSLAPTVKAPEPVAHLLQGKLGKRIATTLVLPAGSTRIALTRRDASRCSMTLRSARESFVSWIGSPDVVALSGLLAGGRYTLSASCGDGKRLAYSLSIVSGPP